MGNEDGAYWWTRRVQCGGTWLELVEGLRKPVTAVTTKL